jgi:membrane associated rhomboid family serine protease
MTEPDPSAHGAETIPHCYRHPDRETYISCQRCGRPICPDCMLAASVGFQCPECVRQGQASVRQARTAYGGRIATRPTLITLSIIVINVVMWIIARATALPGGGRGDFVISLVLIPDASVYGPTVEGVAQGAYWQLLTSAFLHVEFTHLALNMIGVWLFGSLLERELGRWRFLCLYLVSALLASVTVYWLSEPASLSLGASGAVFGLFGAALVILLKKRMDVSFLLILLGLNLVLSFTRSDISWQAHLGGLVVGLLMGAGFAYAPRAQRGQVAAGMTAGLVLLAVVLTALRTAQLTA